MTVSGPRLVLAEDAARRRPEPPVGAALPPPPEPAQAAATALTVEALLTAGEASPSFRIRTVAKKARDLVDQLADLVRHEEETRAARERVAQLEQELAEARTAAGMPKTSGGGKTETAAARSWALAKGEAVPVRGLLPKTLLDAYRRAQQG